MNTQQQQRPQLAKDHTVPARDLHKLGSRYFGPGCRFLVDHRSWARNDLADDLPGGTYDWLRYRPYGSGGWVEARRVADGTFHRVPGGVRVVPLPWERDR